MLVESFEIDGLTNNKIYDFVKIDYDNNFIDAVDDSGENYVCQIENPKPLDRSPKGGKLEFIDEIKEMEEIKSNFISSLNKQQLEFLNKNIINFDKIETDEIVEILTNYLQTNCIINDEVNEEGILIESILDILGEM